MQHPDHHHRHLPHPATAPNPNDPSLLLKRGKKRGNYNCGRCGLPKKGHKCHLTSSDGGDDVQHDRSLTDDGVVVKDEFCNGVSTPISTPIVSSTMDLSSATSPPASAVVRGPPARRGALYFDEDDGDFDDVTKLPVKCLWEILRRLPPSGLVAAGCVCRGWREAARRVWSAADEMRLRVPATARIGFVGFVLQKCPGLSRLTLRIESDVDATFLACIAFSCPNLQSLDISSSTSNWISGVELGRFIADKKCLTSLKMEGCSNLGGFSFSSTSLSTLWLSGLNSLSKMVLNCPNLKEISLDFSRQENDTTDLTSIMDSLGRSCSKLQNIHIASTKLSHAAVLALSAANLRGLRMLSLVLGAEITDASVAAIASSFTKLELLDLSGSRISDSGIGIICNVFPETLSRLLLALCPNITSSGIQFATAQLPFLELLDCGMSISDPSSETLTNEVEPESELQKTPNSKLHHIYQKLIIKHNRLRKLSLWGCSGLDALYLNCPHLNDLNLNSCRNLHPERLDLQCPGLRSVHASDCPVMLVETIETQVCANSSATEYENPLKRYLPDGSKRVRGPLFCSPPQTNDDDEKKQLVRPLKRQCVVIVNS